MWCAGLAPGQQKDIGGKTGEFLLKAVVQLIALRIVNCFVVINVL